MSMRWAWTLPVLSSLAWTLATAAGWAQGQGTYGGGAWPVQGIDPAAYGQAPMPYGQPAMYPPGPMPAYPAGAMASPYAANSMMPPGSYPAAYMESAMGPPMANAYAGPVMGQTPGSVYGPMPGAMPGAVPGPMSGGPDVYGSYGEMPPDYGMGMPMDTGCPYCGGRGCDTCRHLFGRHHRGGLFGHLHHGSHGLCGDIARCILPYSDGGCAAIRWYDFALDFMYMTREDAGRNIVLASTQFGGGDVALATDQLDFDYEPSFRFSGAIQLGPGSNIEFTYFGLFDYRTSAAAVSEEGSLFSVFTDFGLIPPGGLPEFDFSDLQSIAYKSTFDSFEVNFRQRWMAPNCRYQGSWLFGVRHFILDEQFTYRTRSAEVLGIDQLTPAQSRTFIDTTNDLTGLQAGADFWICLIPGLRLGTEVKGGIYGNHMNVNTTLTVNTLDPPDNVFREEQSDTQVALMGEADFLMTYRINYQWTARFGYKLLYVDGVALAPENLNTVLPNLADTTGQIREPFIDHDGDVFLHGWFAGLEFMW